VTTDAVLSGELKSLQEEISASRQKRPSTPVVQTSADGEAAARVDQSPGTAEGEQQRSQLQDLVEAIKGFVEGAEKNIAAHPAANAVGAMIVGILIGRLLGRR
jgi:ElaB/YqjD/DUF883 family membrane-anchored ribosome-binding protein